MTNLNNTHARKFLRYTFNNNTEVDYAVLKSKQRQEIPYEDPGDIISEYEKQLSREEKIRKGIIYSINLMITSDYDIDLVVKQGCYKKEQIEQNPGNYLINSYFELDGHTLDLLEKIELEETGMPMISFRRTPANVFYQDRSFRSKEKVIETALKEGQFKISYGMTIDRPLCKKSVELLKVIRPKVLGNDLEDRYKNPNRHICETEEDVVF